MARKRVFTPKIETAPAPKAEPKGQCKDCKFWKFSNALSAVHVGTCALKMANHPAATFGCEKWEAK